MKKYSFKIHGSSYSVDIKEFENNIVSLEVNGTPYEVSLEQEVKTTKTPKLVRSQESAAPSTPVLKSAPGLSKISAPLPGTIIEIKVKPGDSVAKNDVLLVMEAMKMENNILADKTGTIKSVLKSAGENVLQGDVLVEIQ